MVASVDLRPRRTNEALVLSEGALLWRTSDALVDAKLKRLASSATVKRTAVDVAVSVRDGLLTVTLTDGQHTVVEDSGSRAAGDAALSPRHDCEGDRESGGHALAPWWCVCRYSRSLVVLRGRDQICEAPGRRVSEKVEGAGATGIYHELRRRATGAMKAGADGGLNDDDLLGRDSDAARFQFWYGTRNRYERSAPLQLRIGISWTRSSSTSSK